MNFKPIERLIWISFYFHLFIELNICFPFFCDLIILFAVSKTFCAFLMNFSREYLYDAYSERDNIPLAK